MRKNHIKKLFTFLLSLFLFCLISSFAIYIDLYVTTSPYIRCPKEKKDFAIVLGAGVHGQSLSDALRARMDAAIRLYHSGLVNSVLMTGDGTDLYYNETSVMRKYAIKNGIPDEVISTDEKGYNTYLALSRAKVNFNIQTAYIVSQNFHIVRAVWIARQLGIDAAGIGAGNMKEEWYYNFRDYFAKTKDFLQIKFLLPAY